MMSLKFSSWEKTLSIQILGKWELPDTPNREEQESIACREVGIDPKKLVSLDQIHGADFFLADEIQQNQGRISGDGIYMRSSSFAGSIRTADCLPVYVWDQDLNFAALLHSGWKGLREDISGKFIQFLLDEGIKKQNIQIVIGPGICMNHYQIREDVAKYFNQAEGKSLLQNADGSFQFGMAEYLLDTLFYKFEIQGESSGICTYCSPWFFSHRRGDRGRNLHVMRMEGR